MDYSRSFPGGFPQSFAWNWEKGHRNGAKSAARGSAEQPHSEGRHISFVPEIHLHSDGSECVNTLRGREKYYAQLDSFLKNGIIDRDEYKFMRERYARMDIPDDL